MSAVGTDHDPLRLEPPTTYYDGVVKLPGFDAPPDRCRPVTPVGFCEHGHTVLGRSSCGVRYCPDHWRDWAEEAVISMVARMAAYRQAVDGAEKRVSHVVASPPQDRRYSERAMWNTRSEAYEALEAAGVRGGPVVTHPYRTNDRGDELYATAQEAGEVEDDLGRWAFLRDLADDWEDMTRYIEAAPHYHVPIAPAKDVQPSGTGDWVIKRIRTMRAFHLRETESYRDMVASAYYVLTHGAVQQGKQTTTWFGEVHPASFDPEEELTAAAWSRIQMEAEKAVRETPEEEGEGGVSAGPEECPRDGCEAAVRDVLYLPEYLADDEWVDEIRRGRGGREKVARLRGMYAWWEDRTDRPPPSVLSDKERMRNWLEVRGEAFTPRDRQVSLQTAVMG
jgi:hypothetical protein